MIDKKLDGTKVSKILYEELRDFLNSKKISSRIVDISIGNDFGGEMYANMKKKKVELETGFSFESIHYPEISYENLIKEINEINNDTNICGVMIQLPLPQYLSAKERDILEHISPLKDIDGLTSSSLGNLIIGKELFTPCTPKGIITLLKVYGIDIVGKNVCIINRSNIVGKPLEQLFLKENATTTICHSFTKNLKEITNKSDIIIAALNKQEIITSEYLKKGAVVIDVGVHKNKEGKTVGDVNYNDVYPKASFITPPVGGVGPMTICMLCYNSAISLYGNEAQKVLEKGIEKAKVKVLRDVNHN